MIPLQIPKMYKQVHNHDIYFCYADSIDQTNPYRLYIYTTIKEAELAKLKENEFFSKYKEYVKAKIINKQKDLQYIDNLKEYGDYIPNHLDIETLDKFYFYKSVGKTFSFEHLELLQKIIDGFGKYGYDTIAKSYIFSIKKVPVIGEYFYFPS